jgi:hypothetical protein
MTSSDITDTVIGANIEAMAALLRDMIARTRR